MGGIPGQSKGCKTCKKRKVLCDAVKPYCLRCKKADLDCGGYAAERRFIDETFTTEIKATRKHGKSSGYGVVAIRSSPASEAGSSRTQSSSPQCMDLTGFRDEIQVAFTMSSLLRGAPNAAAWLLFAAGSRQPSILMHESLHALAGAYFGKMHQDRQSEDLATVHYCKALGQMRSVIASKDAYDSQALTSIMALSTYEMVSTNSSTGLLRHAGGLACMIELRGPEKHRRALELKLFEIARLPIIYKAFTERKRCFLEKLEWKTIPWSDYPEQKTMAGHVQDILCDLPGLYVDQDEVQTAMAGRWPNAEQLRDNLYEKIQLCLKTLYQWRRQFETIYPDLTTTVPASSPDSPFPTVYHTTSGLMPAYALALYNATFIYLSEIGKSIPDTQFEYVSASFEISYVNTNTPLHLPGMASPREAAMEICRFVEHFMLPAHAGAGSYFILFPLGAAYGPLQHDADIARWIVRVMANISNSTAFRFVKGILPAKEDCDKC